MAIRYHLHNSKIVKNTYGGVLLLAKFTLLKVTLLQGYFLHFLNCTNGTKSRNTSHISFEFFSTDCVHNLQITLYDQ